MNIIQCIFQLELSAEFQAVCSSGIGITADGRGEYVVHESECSLNTVYNHTVLYYETYIYLHDTMSSARHQ